MNKIKILDKHLPLNRIDVDASFLRLVGDFTDVDEGISLLIRLSLVKTNGLLIKEEEEEEEEEEPGPPGDEDEEGKDTEEADSAFAGALIELVRWM